MKDDLTTCDLVTSVIVTDLTPTKPTKPIYHFLYGSQIYGTLFSVLGKFEITNQCDFKKQISVCLRILNYQGVLNVGFSDAEPIHKPDEKAVYFGVKGNSTSDEKKIILEDLVISDKECIRIIFKRVLFPLPGYKIPLSTIPTTAVLPLPPDGLGQLFDSEFYHRSGLDYYNQPMRLGMSDVVDHSGPMFNGMVFPSLRCTESNVNIFYHKA